MEVVVAVSHVAAKAGYKASKPTKVFNDNLNVSCILTGLLKVTIRRAYARALWPHEGRCWWSSVVLLRRPWTRQPRGYLKVEGTRE